MKYITHISYIRNLATYSISPGSICFPPNNILNNMCLDLVEKMQRKQGISDVMRMSVSVAYRFQLLFEQLPSFKVRS